MSTYFYNHHYVKLILVSANVSMFYVNLLQTHFAFRNTCTTRQGMYKSQPTFISSDGCRMLSRVAHVYFIVSALLSNGFLRITGQRKLTHVPIGLCTKFGELHSELRIFLNFSWVIVIYHFVGCSNVYLKIIVKYEIDHHIRDPLTRDLDFPIFLLIDFKF